MDITIDPDLQKNAVQFVRHVEENLDSSNSDITVETVRYSDQTELPGEEIPMRTDIEYSEWGVRVTISPSDYDQKNQVTDLSDSFYENPVINASHDSEDVIFIFENTAV